MSYIIFNDINTGLQFNEGQAINRNCDGVYTKYWYTTYINTVENKIALKLTDASGNDSPPTGRIGFTEDVTIVQTLEGNFNFQPDEDE